MSSFKSRKLIVLEANIDDMNPEWYGPLVERLFEARALDVTLIPVIMKKSRPGVILQILAEPRLREKLLEIVFGESTTLGVRSYPATRFELHREIKKVKTVYGEVLVKIGRDQKGRVLNISPEYESCKMLSKKKRIPLKRIYSSIPPLT
jgi:uncharacterized protein (DUF111 family)